MVALFCVLWFSVRPFGDFPLNDDWVYALAVRSILETGRFTLPSPSSSNVIVQAYWGALFCIPFGFSFDALRLSTLVLANVAIICQFGLLRDLGIGRIPTTVAALALAFNPIFFQLSATFMTDVPFLALTNLSLWLYVRGAKTDRGSITLVACLVAIAAILIRQFALALPVAFAAAQIARHGWRGRSLLIAALPLIAAIVVNIAFERWMVATQRTPTLPVPLTLLLVGTAGSAAIHMLGTALNCLPLIGLFLLPMLPLSQTYRAQHWVGRLRAPWLDGPVIAVGTILLYATRRSIPEFGNILSPWGLGPLTLRDTWILQLNEPVISVTMQAAWLLLTALSVWGCYTLAVVVLDAIPAMWRAFGKSRTSQAIWPEVMMTSFAATYLVGIILLSNLFTVFDRYIIVLIAPAAAVLLRATGKVARVTNRQLPTLTVLLPIVAIFTITTSHDYFAWNRARWDATSALLAAGVTPHEIDGGYEFNGWYLNNPSYRGKPGKSYWWVDDDEFLVASGPLPRYTETAQYGLSRWWPVGPERVLVLKRNEPH